MFMMHSSAPNRTNRYRISIDTRYQPADKEADERFFGENGEWMGNFYTKDATYKPMATLREEWGFIVTTVSARKTLCKYANLNKHLKSTTRLPMSGIVSGASRSLRPMTWRRDDEEHLSELVHRRFVAEVDEQIVGFGSFAHNERFYHRRRFWIYLDVLPDWRQRGIGTQLYDHMLAIMQSRV